MKSIRCSDLMAVMLLAGLFGTGFSGCDPEFVPSPHTPQGVVLLAAKAIQEGNLNAFKGALTGKALETFGDSHGLQLAKAELETISDLSLSDVVQTNGYSDISDGHDGEQHAVAVTSFSMKVEGWDPYTEEDIVIFEVTVGCRDSRRTVCLEECKTVGQQDCLIEDLQ